MKKNYTIFTNNIISEFSWAIERAGRACGSGWLDLKGNW